MYFFLSLVLNLLYQKTHTHTHTPTHTHIVIENVGKHILNNRKLMYLLAYLG